MASDFYFESLEARVLDCIRVKSIVSSANLVNSIHSLPPTLSGSRGASKPGFVESRHLQDHWKTMESSLGGGTRKVECSRKGKISYHGFKTSITYMFHRRRKIAINSNTLITATSPSDPVEMALVVRFRASVTILRDSQHVTDVVAVS